MANDNFDQRRDAIQSAIENMNDPKPLVEQSHPLLMEDGTNICEIANDYVNNREGHESWIMMQEDFSKILPILEAIDMQQQGKSRRKAADSIVKFVKNHCCCIPKRRKKNA